MPIVHEQTCSNQACPAGSVPPCICKPPFPLNISPHSIVYQNTCLFPSGPCTCSFPPSILAQPQSPLILAVPPSLNDALEDKPEDPGLNAYPVKIADLQAITKDWDIPPEVGKNHRGLGFWVKHRMCGTSLDCFDNGNKSFCFRCQKGGGGSEALEECKKFYLMSQIIADDTYGLFYTSLDNFEENISKLDEKTDGRLRYTYTRPASTLEIIEYNEMALDGLRKKALK